MIGTSAARNPEGSYVAYGHSIITDPWGDVVMQLDEKPGIGIADIDLDYVEEVRQKLPLLSARRTDIYTLESK
jgi:predicted amidohydrolase